MRECVAVIERKAEQPHEIVLVTVQIGANAGIVGSHGFGALVKPSGGQGTRFRAAEES
jgi:hypothetical protein